MIPPSQCGAEKLGEWKEMQSGIATGLNPVGAFGHGVRFILLPLEGAPCILGR